MQTRNIRGTLFIFQYLRLYRNASGLFGHMPLSNAGRKRNDAMSKLNFT